MANLEVPVTLTGLATMSGPSRDTIYVISPTTITVTIFSTPTETGTPQCVNSGFDTFFVALGWIFGAPLICFALVGLIVLGAWTFGCTLMHWVEVWCMWRKKRKEMKKIAEEERQKRDLERAEKVANGSRYEAVRGEEDDSLLTVVEGGERWVRVKSWFRSWAVRRTVGEKTQMRSMEEYGAPKDVNSDTEVESLNENSKMG